MSQFILIAYDATDEGALQRRMDTRNEHLRSVARMRDNGNIVCGLAITDDHDKMIGSVIVANFETRQAFDAWLANDPYTVAKVWEKITVLDAKMAPTFQDLITKTPLR